MDRMLAKEILNKAKALSGKIIDYRRTLHENPELGFEEKQTTDFIIDKLNKLNIETNKNLFTKRDIKLALARLGEKIKKNQSPTGAVGILNGEKKGKTVLLRAELDALSIQETDNSNHLPNKEGFRSKNKGLMHACGHDAHIAILLGTAELLSSLRGELNGNIKFLFQPDEERGCGARLMSEAGVLSGVDAAYGLHLWAPLNSGKVMINNGPVMAGVDNFWLNFKGGGGHSSMPDKTQDPLLAANELLNLIYKIKEREFDINNPSLISVENFRAEGDWGVIPDESILRGSIRFLDDRIGHDINKRIKEIGEHLGALFNLEFSYNNESAFPPVINTEREAEISRSAAGIIFGENNVIEGKHVMSGEDFGYYLKKVPGTFILMGTGNEKKGICYPHHNSAFRVDESNLYRGAALLAATAINYLNEHR